MGVELHLPDLPASLLWAGMKGYLPASVPPLLDPEVLAELVHQASTGVCSLQKQTLWEVVLVLILSAITYYRRELSSNRVYHPKKEDKAAATPTPRGVATATAPPAAATTKTPKPSPAAMLQQLPTQFHALLVGGGDGGASGGAKAFPAKLVGEVQARLAKLLALEKEGKGQDKALLHDWMVQAGLLAAAAAAAAGAGAGGDPAMGSPSPSSQPSSPSAAFSSLLSSLGSRAAQHQQMMQEHQQQQQQQQQEAQQPPAPSTFLPDMPEDVQLQVLGHLQPRDILQLGMASRGCRELADRDVVWRLKWRARFGALWASSLARAVLGRRHPGPTALSGPLAVPLALPRPRRGWKRFYSEFELEWVNWLIAGYNTEERCLVGIGKAVYDLTPFLEHHPGSKETILINAGCDATSFFEDVGHSVQARALMQDFLELRLAAGGADACVLEGVRAELAEARRRIEGGLGGARRSVGRRLRSLSGGVAASFAFSTFPEQAAAVLMGGPVAAGTEEEEEEEEEMPVHDDEDGEAGSGGGLGDQHEDDKKEAAAANRAALFFQQVGDWLAASAAEVAAASSPARKRACTSARGGGGTAASSSSPSSPSSCHGGCGCVPAACAVPTGSAAAAAFLPAAGVAAAPCPEGMHTGVKRAVLDLVSGEWLSWRSCCGEVKCERAAAVGEDDEGAE